MSKKVSCQCGECGKGFERFPSLLSASKSGKVFCSLTCRAAYFAKDKRRDDLVCARCGNTFSRSQSEIAKSGGDTVYCSRSCYDAARQEIVETRVRPVGRGGKDPVHCERCGTLFYIKPSIFTSRQKHFCSMECKRLGTVTSGTHVPKAVVRRVQTQHCVFCGEDDSEVLEIHHKDRDRKNNDLSNLVVLCANCHARLHKGKLVLQ